MGIRDLFKRSIRPYMKKSTPKATSPKAKGKRRSLDAFKRVKQGLAEPGEHLWEPELSHSPVKIQVREVAELILGPAYYTDISLSFAYDCQPWTELLELLYGE